MANGYKYRVRKHGMTEDLYLQRDGTWGRYGTAKRMTVEAAEKFAAKHGIGVNEYGLFP